MFIKQEGGFVEKNLLIVHYNPRDLEQRASWAAELGFAATTVHNCDEALNAVANTDFLLALIDPLLPGMSGFSLAEKIAASSPGTTVLLASALYKRMQFVAHSGAANIRMVHLDKPLDETSFKTLITRQEAPVENKEKTIRPPEKQKPEASNRIDLGELLKLDPELNKLWN